MYRSSRAITLILVGTASALLGYEALTPGHSTDWGSDFSDADNPNNGDPTTGPSSGNGYFGSPGYYHHSSFWYWGSGFNSFHGGGHHSSSGGYSSSSGHSGTSHGGFGHSGHGGGS